MQAKDLTPGEKLFLFRRRLGFTEVQMAVDFGVCVPEYQQMELDGPGTKIPYMSLRYLLPQEEYVIRRRRLGLSQPQLASLMRVTPEHLDMMEGCEAPVDRLSEYWGRR